MKSVRFYPFEGPAREARVPFAGAASVVVEGACPVCDANPFNAAGVRASLIRGHDTYTADAGCVGCRVVSGKLVVTVSTIFGIEEDERMLAGRCRVY